MTAALRGVARVQAYPALALMRDTNTLWNASLQLCYERRAERTVMTANEHFGPLVVQKSLYPEGFDVCQTVILHPPGGIAGGDQLAIDVRADASTVVQLTTPGATKWYKANGRAAAQYVALACADNAVVEWLPLENIVFDGAIGRSTLAVDLRGNASAAGWDIAAFGRAASGERFGHGRFRQTIELRRDGELLWAEYADVRGSDPLFASAIGFAGHTVSGLMWVASRASVSDTMLEACRAVGARMASSIRCGLTLLPGGVLLARCLCDSTEVARSWLIEVWALLRPSYARREAVVPRLWLT